MDVVRQVRSVRAREGVAIQRFKCAWCGLGWNRLPKPGRAPRFCSDACKQASWREKAAVARRIRDEQVALFHAEFDQITAAKPLPLTRVVPLLHGLAGSDPSHGLPVSRLYRTAAAAWHPDRPGGNHKVFQLLQEAHRLARLHAL
ncbi:hypothetical protein [Streptomyces qaidamensis]|uniref:hypothetical protein n=1 Tax=Streptomyces qaidamensis TaxID=1783515 RepID=UPI00131D666F|nr:hypothetical protein [Streptomyces qaidamensis]